jgi:hypothetical protein
VFPKAKDGADLHKLMQAAFPVLGGIEFIDISSRYLYPASALPTLRR